MCMYLKKYSFELRLKKSKFFAKEKGLELLFKNDFTWFFHLVDLRAKFIIFSNFASSINIIKLLGVTLPKYIFHSRIVIDDAKMLSFFLWGRIMKCWTLKLNENCNTLADCWKTLKKGSFLSTQRKNLENVCTNVLKLHRIYGPCQRS